MKHIFTLLVVAALSLTSCADKQEILVDSQIDGALKRSITAKNDSLITALVKSDNNIFRALGSTAFVDHIAAHTSNVSWAFRPRRYTKGNYKIYDELQVIHADQSVQSHYTSPDKGYTYTWVNRADDTYISMLKMPFVQQDYLMILQYIKDKAGKWKINHMELIPVGRYGLTAFDYFAEARKQATKYPLDAYFYCETALAWIADLKGSIKFDMQDEVESYKKDLAKGLNEKYPFPWQVKELASKPRITDVSMATVVEGIYPMVTYQTGLTDSLARVKEYKDLNRVLPRLYPDMDFNKRFTIFNVSIPRQDQNGNTYRNTEQYVYDSEK